MLNSFVSTPIATKDLRRQKCSCILSLKFVHNVYVKYISTSTSQVQGYNKKAS